MTFKPMLAANTPEDLTTLRFPLLASPKLDGIRCTIRGGRAVTRSLKPIPNDFVRNYLEALGMDSEGFDGELLLDNLTAPFAEVSSAIMKKTGEPNFTFAVFDDSNDDGVDHPFYSRLQVAAQYIEAWKDPRVMAVVHSECDNLDQLLKMHQIHIEAGFEGTMVRDPDGHYKHGRSTLREGLLIKIKDFLDEEAVVYGVEPLYRNNNEKTVDNLGHAKRSTDAAGLVADDLLGVLVCQMDDGTEVRLGSGFSETQRIELWKCRDVLNGMRAKFKHLPPPGGRGAGVKPRHPVFLGWRDPND